MPSRSKKITICAALTAIGLMLGYIESFIVFPIRVPGVRIGLANIVTVMCLYTLGISYSAVVLMLRITLSAILFGSPVSFAYSIAGATLSLLGMILLKRFGFSIYGVSFSGAVLHNIAQTAVAYYMVSSVYIFTYLPVRVITGAIAGLITGFVADILIKRLGNVIYTDRRI